MSAATTRNELGDESGASVSEHPAILNLRAYREAYARADRLHKEVQSFTAGTGTAVIDEMRSAGHHLLYALADDGTLVSHNSLETAIDHANTASYEAGAIGIRCALERITQFKNDYRTIVISEVILNYGEILNDVEDAREHLKALKSKTIHSGIIDSFARLQVHCKVITTARDELDNLIKRDRVEAKRFIVNTLVATGILLAAVLFGIPALVQLFK
jgi:hypothetical protein